jgi:hypothetical protein
MMARMLSTFSQLEQSRFEAYKRATLPADAVQEWIAAMLVHRLALLAQPSTTTTSTTVVRSPLLSELVTPGCHDEIGMVVSTAAKVYAQRLVAAAIRIAATAKGTNAECANSPTTTTLSSSSTAAALQPELIWQAVQERRGNGLDPGFYLQPNDCYQWSSGGVVGGRSAHEQRRLAALEAQEAYDKEFGLEASNNSDNQQHDNMVVNSDDNQGQREQMDDDFRW